MNLTAVAGKTVSKMEFLSSDVFLLSLDESRRFRMINKRKVIVSSFMLPSCWEVFIRFSKLRCVEFNAK